LSTQNYVHHYKLLLTTLIGPPSITSPNTEIDTIEGHELILTCAATNDIKSPFNADISWYGPQGEVIEESNNNIDISAIKIENVLTSALKFKSVNHTLTGVSKCKASNHPMSSSEFNFTITVECKLYRKIYTVIFKNFL